jgi:hypothetical protein
VGTVGFFWWELPVQRERFYESLTDLEHDAGVGIAPSDSTIDWGRGALSEEDLRRVALVLAFLPRAEEKEAHPVFDQYLTGLGLLAKATFIFVSRDRRSSALLQASDWRWPTTTGGMKRTL